MKGMPEEMCRLVSSCREKECREPVLLIPGWDRSLPSVGGAHRNNFLAYANEYLGNRDIYYCSDLPYYEEKHSTKRLTPYLEKEVKRIRGDGKIVLIGGSFGGFVVQDYAAKHPNKVDKLVLLFTVQSYPYDDILNITKGQIRDVYTKLREIPLIRSLIDAVSIDKRGEGGIDDILNWVDIDLVEESKKVTADTFIVNCESDSFLGTLPKIADAKVEVKNRCDHHVLTESDFEEMTAFINEK